MCFFSCWFVFRFCCLINETLSIKKQAQSRIRVITERIWNDADVIGHNLREALIRNLPVQEEENDEKPRSLYKALGRKYNQKSAVLATPQGLS